MMATLSATSAPSLASQAAQNNHIASQYNHNRTSSSSTSSPLNSPSHTAASSTASAATSSPPSSNLSSQSNSPVHTCSSSTAQTLRLSSTCSPVFPPSSPPMPSDTDWSNRTPHMWAGGRKGAKTYQEDSWLTYISPSESVYIGAVFDGHGGYNGTVASCTARDYLHRFCQANASELEGWSSEEWQQLLRDLFERMHAEIKRRFVEDSETSNTHANSMAGGKRYVDEKGIVRSANGDPVHGGSTATVIVMKQDREAGTATLITANVGDSTALLLPRDGEHSFLSIDHGPENPEEYARICQLPASQHPLKLLFVYDKTNQLRKYDCPLVFLQPSPSQPSQRDPVYVSNPWGHGLHPTNVRYEPAVYAVTPKAVVKDSTCIAMTRALGDFYAHQFGLSWVPSITAKQLVVKGSSGASGSSGGEEAVEAEGFVVVLASDGIWDCWKYEEFHAYLCALLFERRLSVGAMGETALDESMERAIANFGNKHYDDACVVVWQFGGSSTPS